VSSEPKRVLFVCIGNACRSQMAEGFARTYGSDVIIPASAGLSPAMRILPNTIRAMQEKGIDLTEQFPKSLQHVGRTHFDFVVNMSGYELPVDMRTSVLYWNVPDPVTMDYEKHCAVRDQIESMVMRLIIQLRQEAKSNRSRKSAV
jgi:arsenate reductase